MFEIISFNSQGMKHRKLGPEPFPASFGHVSKIQRPIPDYIYIERPDVVLMQEVNVVQRTFSAQSFPSQLFPGYSVYFAPNMRTLVMVRSDHASEQLNISHGNSSHSHDFSSTWVKVTKMGRPPLLVCSVYRPQKCTPLKFRDFENEIFEARQHTTDLLIGGDINGEHTLWGAEVNNANGEAVAEILLSSGLVPLNSPGPTHRCPATDKLSTIDLFAVSSSLVSSTTPTSSCPALQCGSDHMPICLSITGQRAGPGDVTVWDLPNANWEMYRNELSRTLPAWCESIGKSFLPMTSDLQGPKLCKPF